MPTRRCRSASSAPRWRCSRRRACDRARRSTSWRATSSTSPSRRSPKAATCRRSTASPGATRTARIVHNPDRAILEDMDQLPFVTEVYKRDLRDRGLFHRLPAASVRLALHRPRLQIALHVLPVAADGRRPPLPGALARRMSPRRSALASSLFPQVREILLRRRHLHRQPAARRGDRPRARQARRHLVAATPRRTCRARR